MREIKFRIWAKDPCSNQSEHKMIYLPKWTVFDGQDLVFRADLETFWIDSSASSEDVVLMQYTGLKDRNGREIYDGDLFPADRLGNLYRVAWNNEAAKFSVVIERTSGKMIGIPKIAMQDLCKREICGNICQNPISAGL